MLIANRRLLPLCQRRFSCSNRLLSTNVEVSVNNNERIKHSENVSMPTPLSLGFNMTYQPALNDPDESRPLIVVAAWMGATQKQLKPYLKFYHEKNFSTLSFAVGPHHVLFPNKAMSQMEQVVQNVSENNRDVTFHHFSVGGFLYGQLLQVLKSDKFKGENLERKIRGQIFDSPPDFMNISKGIARSMGMGGVVEALVERIARTYLALTYNTSGVLHRQSSAAFHGNKVSAPSLWFYSKADPVADWRDCVTVVEKWRSRGTEVEECVWEDTPHIQHGRVDPQRYFGTLASFLQKLNIEENTFT